MRMRGIWVALVVVMVCARAGAAEGPLAGLAVPGEEQLKAGAGAKLAEGKAATPEAGRVSASGAALAERYPAEEFDPELRAKALGEGIEPVFEYVRDRVKFESYPGVLRGATGAYMTRAANAADRSLLLAKMLETKGVSTRLARGKLAREDAEKLVMRMFEPVAGAPVAQVEGRPGDAAVSGSGAEFLERLRARATRDYAAILGALGGELPAAGVWGMEQLVEEVSGHVWVQARVGQKWVDLDSAFADAAVGKAYAKAERTFTRPPEDWHQRVVMRVVVEKLEGGRLRKETVLELNRAGVDLVGRRVFLMHAPVGGWVRIGSVMGAKSADDWTPVVWVDGETTAGKAISFGGGAARGGATGLFDSLPGGEAAPKAAGAEFVSETLEFEVRLPGGKKETVRRVLCDRGGAAWRAAAKPDAKALRPLERNERGVVAAQTIHNIWFSAGRHDLAAFGRDVKLLGEAMAAESRAADAAPGAAAEPPAAPKPDPDAALADGLWPIALQNFSCVVWGDHAFVPALNTDPAVRFYADSPRILLFSITAAPTAGREGEVTVSSVIDLRRDTIRGVARDPAGTAAVTRGKVWYGVLEGALEHELSAQAGGLAGEGSTVQSTSATLDDRGAVAVRPTAEHRETWPNGAPRKETAARAAAALAAGETLVIPVAVLSDSKSDVPAWWALSAAGDVRAVWGDDLHAGRMESSTRLRPGSRGMQSNRFPRPGRAARVGRGSQEYVNLLDALSLPVSELAGTVTGNVVMFGAVAGEVVISILLTASQLP